MKIMVISHQTSAYWASIIKRPEDREQVVKAAFAKLGAKLESIFVESNGDRSFCIVEVSPDRLEDLNVMSLQLKQSGMIDRSEIIHLNSFQEMLTYCAKVQEIDYPSPADS